ncbi:hypothetical protein [Sphingobium sp. LB126]|uniref:hypothetical protein n=1 Tax=Sphingobium sp. LB126 TaxID=1983755 RepID=UPI001F5BD3B3|nr:hypothetical protein [Sphingobium sp. LB126]
MAIVQGEATMIGEMLRGGAALVAILSVHYPMKEGPMDERGQDGACASGGTSVRLSPPGGFPCCVPARRVNPRTCPRA